MYDFDRQWTFRPGYMAKNTRLSRGHRGNDENSMGGGGTLWVKGKWDENLFVVSLRQGGKACESTHFLLVDYWAAGLA